MKTRSMSKSSTQGALPSNKPNRNRVAKSSRRKEAPQRSPGTKSTPLPSTRPSQGWESGNGRYYPRTKEGIDRIFETANWDFLCSEAVRCYKTQSAAPRRVTCEIHRDRFSSGFHNLILEVSFSDLTYWIVRIAFPDHELNEARFETQMLSEVHTMRLVQERTSIPVPTVFGYNFKPQNPFGFRYMFMSVLPGHPLDLPFGQSIPKQHQAKVADQYANILHELGTKMTFDKIGRLWCGENGKSKPRIISFDACGAKEGMWGWYPIGPFSTSLEYFYALRKHESACVRAGIANGDLPGLDPALLHTACWVMDQGLIPCVNMGKMTGPFPLQHMDLKFTNILVDDEFNISGVIDWTFAQTVPCEAFRGGPELCVFNLWPGEISVQRSSFRDMVGRAWKEKDSKTNSSNSDWSMSENVGSKRAQVIEFSWTNGFQRRTIEYARQVGRLIHGDEFSLEDYHKHLGTAW